MGLLYLQILFLGAREECPKRKGEGTSILILSHKVRGQILSGSYLLRPVLQQQDTETRIGPGTSLEEFSLWGKGDQGTATSQSLDCTSSFFWEQEVRSDKISLGNPGRLHR